MSEVKVVVDTQSGEGGVRPAVEGAINAQRGAATGLTIILVGNAREIEDNLRLLGKKTRFNLQIVDACEVVTMEDTVRQALRKERSAVAIGMDMVASGTADLIVSSCNTAAYIAYALTKVGPIEKGIRPCLATHMPTDSWVGIFTDVGANPSCQPIDLYWFAVMASLYREIFFDLLPPRPAIALIANGKEARAGNELVKEAEKLLRSLPNFIGYVEPDSFLKGEAQIVIASGWDGNLVLKAYEGMALRIQRQLGEQFKGTLGKIAGATAHGRLRRLKQILYPNELAHAYLLGTKRIVIKTHGSANKPEIFTHAILSGVKSNQADLVGILERNIIGRN